MTRDEIINMPAGRELDVLVAEKVMGEKGFKPVIDAITEFNGFGVINRPVYGEIEFSCYSTSIVAAWEVVEKFIFQLHHGVDGYWCVLMTPEEINGQDVFEAGGDTAPLAICRAALLVVNG